MPHSPSNVGLPGPSWAAPPLSLADSGGWERPSSPLIFEEPSQIVSALPPPQPLPPRPGFGSRGRPSVVLTNFTDLAVGEVDVFKHDVTFTPEMKTSQVRRRILTELAPQIQQLLPEAPFGWAYDGDKILYSVGRLGAGPIELRRGDEEGPETEDAEKAASKKKREVIVSLKEVGQLNLGGLRLPSAYEGSSERLRPMMQVLDIVLMQHHATFHRSIGHGVFNADDEQQHLLLGSHRACDTELWLGHRQTVVLTDSGPMLKVDLAATTMLAPMSVLEFVAYKLDQSPTDLEMDAEQIEYVGRQLQDKKVKSTHNDRKWRIRGISSEPASRSMFVDYTDTQISVVDYFQKHHNITLTMPHLPCLKVGREFDPVEIPMEVCKFLPGQVKRDLTSEQKVAMIKETCAPPNVRYETLKQIVQIVQANNAVCRAFGISTDPAGLKSLMGRVLDPLPLMYKDINGHSAVVNPDGYKGHWNMRLRGNELRMAQVCERVVSWVVFSFCPSSYVRPQLLDAFLRQLVFMAGQRGITMGRPLEVLEGSPTGDVELLLHSCAERYASAGRPLQLCFCVIPDRGNSAYLYPAIKRWANTSGGIPSQCVQAGRLLDRAKYGVAYVSNVLLKLNLKLGGQNVHPSPMGCTLVQATPTIVLGADVYHAPPGTDRPSFAAVVASMDRHLATYHSIVTSQLSRCEVIESMEEMVTRQLRRFYELNGQLAPRRIFFYRDGVGVSQFPIIKQREVAAIRRACVAIGGETYKPKLVFVVVQKRNHCRLFHEADGQIENALPGTVVDTVITTGAQFDFYLCSHYGLRGTSRPTHYHVLNDDVDLSADEIQRFTFDLCHLYARCTKIVSSPAPTYYAHRAAHNAHYHMSNFREEYDDGKWNVGRVHSTTAEGSTGDGVFLPVVPHMEDRLYYA